MKIDKKDPLIARIKEKVDEQYAAGRTTAIADEELDAMFLEFDAERHSAFAAYL